MFPPIDFFFLKLHLCSSRLFLGFRLVIYFNWLGFKLNPFGRVNICPLLTCISIFRSLLCGLTVDGTNLVAHGEADQVIIGVKHHKDLVDAQLLRGRGPHVGISMRAALKGDSLTPLVAPGLHGATG